MEYVKTSALAVCENFRRRSPHAIMGNMLTIFGLLVIVLANTWAHPSTSASTLTDFPETMITEVPIGSFTEDNVTVTTTFVTETAFGYIQDISRPCEFEILYLATPGTLHLSVISLTKDLMVNRSMSLRAYT
ncbi:hypothetical protein TNCT_385741 [Trichonephila clavata]|uniref:Uncharacterized protein n=1 Tax=Trichonephila clavata TaxID=2740835 RepID=A0A8X6KQS2_TRICU|nr:hypothetical protein TNCT_385741 [Trichonephila clavata]